MEMYVDLFVEGFSLGFAIVIYAGFITAALNAVWGILESTK